MNTFKSLILGAAFRINSLHSYRAKQINYAQVSHVALSSKAKDDYEAMTVKALRSILTELKVKGRSKLTRKADIIAKLRSL